MAYTVFDLTPESPGFNLDWKNSTMDVNSLHKCKAGVVLTGYHNKFSALIIFYASESGPCTRDLQIDPCLTIGLVRRCRIGVYSMKYTHCVPKTRQV